MKNGRKAPAGREDRRAPTMMDVAAAAGVSQTTVSLVLNNIVEARLSATTRQRVRAAALALGYALPGPAPATAGAVGATTIGFLCDDVSTDPWCAQAFSRTASSCWAHQGSVETSSQRKPIVVAPTAPAVAGAGPGRA